MTLLQSFAPLLPVVGRFSGVLLATFFVARVTGPKAALVMVLW